MVTLETRTARLRDRALTLGFSHFGVARATALEQERERFHDWLDASYHAGMRYLERTPERRTDPHLLLDGAQSVIMVALNYFHPDAHDGNEFRISRYAWGDDYHEIILPKLTALQEYLQESVPGAESKIYIDTGPVMEKAWAVRAGIGWLGKNVCLITRDIGSWVFLGAIITTATFEYNEPISDFCGRCRRCLDACPTDALVQPYVLDSAKCISYLTIELKGDDGPEQEGLDFQNWAFGCDICQDVCPWNRFAIPSAETSFEPREEIVHLNEEDFAIHDETSFRHAFARSPLLRPGLNGMRRNIRRILKRKQ
jgi:epoxyqueuosine reductase